MIDMSQPGVAGRRPRTPSAKVERELLAAAEAVLVREGRAGLTVRAVATEAGIAQMGVYNRFGGKDGLIDALLIKGFDMLRASIEAGREPDMFARLRNCGLRYREFALANPHFYALMFEEVPPRHRQQSDNDEVATHAVASFGALVRQVELASVAGIIKATEPVEVAQQIWSAVHGAVALEMKGLVLSPDPETTYAALVDTLMRGLAP